ncbi:MAG: lipid-A-disaccharide synthase [Candidatus Cloacimonetes bacterium]|nr:lipid-A-disaccharide synthase [Candidatus Cloacimonadota bacterium]
MKRKRIFVCAGEYSGSLYMSATVKSILQDYPELEIYGIGGSEMEKAGARLLYNSDSWGSIGLVEALKRWYLIPVNFAMRKRLSQDRPDLVLLADYPGFNMHLARSAQNLGIPCVYLFPPRKFAKSPTEVKEAASVIRRVAAEFLPTYEVYREAGAKVDFVGHPMLDTLPRQDRVELRKQNGVLDNQMLVLVLPGSRAQEVSLMLPLFSKTIPLLHSRFPNLRFHILGAENLKSDSSQKINLEQFTQSLKNQGVSAQLIWEDRFSQMQMADFALVTSGTATMELMVYGVPMVICYKVSILTEILARCIFYQLPEHIGLPNLLAGTRLVPELVQRQATPENLTQEVLQILKNPTKLSEIRQKFSEVSAKLGGIGSVKRLKSVIYEELGLRK